MFYFFLCQACSPCAHPSPLPHVTFILHISYVFLAHSLRGQMEDSRMTYPHSCNIVWKTHTCPFYPGRPWDLLPFAPSLPFHSTARWIRSPRKHILYPKHQHTLFPLNSRIKGRQTIKPEKPVVQAGKILAASGVLGWEPSLPVSAVSASERSPQGRLRLRLLQDSALCLQNLRCPFTVRSSGRPSSSHVLSLPLAAGWSCISNGFNASYTARIVLVLGRGVSLKYLHLDSAKIVQLFPCMKVDSLSLSLPNLHKGFFLINCKGRNI